MSVAQALVPVIEAHRFDVAALQRWLADSAPSLAGDLMVLQFQGGQSNPTFLLDNGIRQAVLRKKPPGDLLPKAHNVEREARVIGALGDTHVPVPRVLATCSDPDVIGTSFYVMEYVTGRVFEGPLMAGTSSEERHALHLAAVDTLALLHGVNFTEVGLADFGPHGNYVARQVDRWSRQYESSLVAGEIPSLTWLAHWLREHQSVEDATTLTHGDYRHGNLCYASDATNVLAIFDWELSTLGHPLSDLAYYCMPYHVDATTPGGRGVQGLDLDELGIPDERSVIERYCEATGQSAPVDWNVFLALAFFRLSAILHGVMARAIQGNASSANARLVAQRATTLADIGRMIATTT